LCLWPKGFRHDPYDDSERLDCVATIWWHPHGSSALLSSLVIASSRFYTSSGFGLTSCGSPPPNCPENILIFQVPEEILISCKEGGLTKASTQFLVCFWKLVVDISRKRNKIEVVVLFVQ
jgi:hypothetical protein